MNQFNSRVTYSQSHIQITSLKKMGTLAIIPLAVLFALGLLFGALWVDSSSAAPAAPEGPTLYVTASGEPTSNCTIANPCTLQHALDFAEDGDEIQMAAGTYTANTAPVLLITADITVTGGFSTDDDWATSDPVMNLTILDAEENGRVVRVASGSNAIIQGVDIRNGFVNTIGGGGVLVENGATAVIRNNYIHDNLADDNAVFGGGGLYVIGNTIIEDNLIYDNTAIFGGGIRIGDGAVNSNSNINYNRIYNNDATVIASGEGGGIYLSNSSSGIIDGNSIYNNVAGSGGGVSVADAINSTLLNNVIYKNQATESVNFTGGGGVFLFFSTVTLWNNTIAYNSSAYDGGGIYSGASTTEISNNTIVSNTAANTNSGIFQSGGTVIGGYNNIHNNTINVTTLDNPFSRDPAFNNNNTPNLRLSSSSDDINAGNALSVTVGMDIDQQVRDGSGGSIDIGADEYQAATPLYYLTPLVTEVFVERGTTAVFNHQLENIGTITGTYTFSCSNSDSWTTTCPSTVTDLAPGGIANVQTSVAVPNNALPLDPGTTVITASNGTTDIEAAVYTIIAPHPGVSLTANITTSLLPGEVYTLEHTLTNLSDAPDDLVIEVTDLLGWVTQPPASPENLGPGQDTPIYTVLQVGSTAASGVFNIITIKASSAFSPSVSATVVNTITAKPTAGDRYVAGGGDDTDNNCTVEGSPCATVAQAVSQARYGDTVYINPKTGAYVSELPISLLTEIQIIGRGEDPSAVVLQSNTGRLFNVTAIQPTIQNLTLRGGSADTGGAVLVRATAQIKFVDVIFDSNSASGNGGALYAETGAVVILETCEFMNNDSGSDGGALFMNNSTLHMQQSRFDNNTAVSDGGAIFATGSAIYGTNNLIAQNNATNGDGGGIYATGGSMKLRFNTIADNGSGATGGGIYANSTVIDIEDTAVTSNTAVIDYHAIRISGAPSNFEWNVLWPSGGTSFTPSATNEDLNPLYGGDPNYRALPESPLTDKDNRASDIINIAVDFEDDFRPSDQGYDVGWDELAGCRAKRGETIHGSIQDAVDAITETVKFIQVTGICRGTTGGQTVLLNADADGLIIQGGWNGDFSVRDYKPTYVDPESGGRAFYINDADVTIELLTLINGDADGLGGGIGEGGNTDAGGAIYIVSGDVTLNNININSSTADMGGAIYNQGGQLHITSFEPPFNIGSGEEDLSEISTIYNNTANVVGGGIYNESGSLIAERTMVISNTAGDGGGLYLFENGSNTLLNIVVAENSASGSGGGLFVNATSELWHMTVYGNQAATGDGLYNAAGNSNIQNSIFENNGQAINVASGSPTIDYNSYNSDTLNVPGGLNSIDSTPAGLIDPAGGDYHLSDISPLLDIGAVPSIEVATDFDNEIRPSNQGYDMGADELMGCLARTNDVIYGNIQVALGKAIDGGVIDVAGRCTGVHPYDTGGALGTISQTVHITKNIRLVGGWDIEFAEQESVTLLNAQSLGRVFYIAPNMAVTIDNFDITAGNADDGGAIYIDHAADAQIIGNNIYSNTAVNGAAIYSVESLTALDRGNNIHHNTATNGSVYLTNTVGMATVQNNFFYLNEADNGAAVYNMAGNNQLRHNTVYNNSATDNGGAFYIAADAPDVRNNIFMDNDTGNGGALLFGAGTSAPTVDYNDYFINSAPTVGGTIADEGTHSIAVNPAFGDPANADFTIYFTSTVVDQGDPFVNLLYDAEDTIRPSHNGMDMGAYEVGGCYARDIISPTVIYGSVQTAVNQAADDATIEVDGVCYGVQTITNTGDIAVNQTLFIAKPVTIDGSWVYENSISEELTALAPLGRGRAIFVDSTAVSVTVKNIILRDGDGNGAGVVNGGGAVYNAGTDVTLTAVELHNNSAGDGGAVYNVAQLALGEDIFANNTAVNGGAVYNLSDGLVITNSTFLTSTATNGGAIYNVSGNGAAYVATVKNNEFYNSSASTNGGAIYHANGRFLIDGNTVGEGYAIQHGGAFYLTVGSTNTVEVWNNIVYNTTAAVGGAIYDDNSNASIWHNTLFNGHSTTNRGGGIHSESSTSASIYNNIVDSGFSGQNGSAVSFGGSATADVGYNFVRGYNMTYTAPIVAMPTGDIHNSAPSYVDISQYDLHLEYDSMGMDVGLGTPPSIVLHDIDGDERPVNSGVDMGADEINTCQLRVGDELFHVFQEAIDYSAASGISNIEMARGICSGVQDGPDGIQQVGYISHTVNIIGSLLPDTFEDLNDYYYYSAVSSRIDARGEGRAIYVASGVTAVFTHIAFVNGDATMASDSNADGGGIYVDTGATVNFYENPICGNSADNGGGLYAATLSYVEPNGGQTGRCRVIDSIEEIDGLTIIHDTPFIGNIATVNGGGMYLDGTFLIKDHGLLENSAVNGGGVYADGNGDVINGIFYMNEASNDGGGLYNDGTANVYHSTIAANVTANSGAGIKNVGTMSIVNSNIFYGNGSINSAVANDGGISSNNYGALEFNLFDDNIPEQAIANAGTDYIFADPLLWPSLTIPMNSPAVDKADPDLVDLNADPRITYDAWLVDRPDGNTEHHNSPKRSDIGASEYFKDFGCQILPENPARTGVAGQETVYVFYVTNTGWQIPPTIPNHTYTDTITVTLNSTSMGWGALASNILVFDDMAPHESRPFTLTVTVPQTVTAGTDTSIVACEPGGMPERQRSAAAMTNIGPVYNVDIGPSYTAALLPGESVTFTHTITNIGNMEDTYELIPKPGTLGQTTAVVIDDLGNDISGITMTLSPQETIEHLLRITALPNATAGVQDTPGATVESLKEDAQDGVIDYINIGVVPGTRYVSASGTDNSNCTSINSPCATIQHAIDQAVDGDSILVAAGDYTTAVTATVASEIITQTIFIDKSLNIIGGYSTADNFSQQRTISNATTLDSSGTSRIVYITDGNDVTLGGLFIQNGSIIAENGGGIYNAGSNLSITSTLLLSNDAVDGSALYHVSGDLTIQSSVIANNISNDGAGNGAGLYVSANMTGTGNLINNSFVNNNTAGDGGAGYVENGTFTLQNNIFDNNRATSNSGIHFAGGTLSVNEYNLYHANNPAITIIGTNGIEDDPLFTDVYIHISSASPAKNSGLNGVLYALGVDVDGENRTQGGFIDIGADEVTQTPTFDFAPELLTATLPAGGDSHIYTHILTNTSDFVDGYTFDWIGSDPLPTGGTWISKVSTIPVDTSSIAIGGTVNVTVIITGTGDGHQFTMDLTAASLADNLVSHAVRNITTIDQATPDVEIGLSEADIGVAGDIVTFNHTITNTGSGANMYTLSQLPPTGWNTVIMPSGNIWLEAGDTAPFTVTIQIPVDAVFGQQYIANIEANSVDLMVSDQLSDTVTVSDGSASITITPNTRSMSIESGETAVYTHTVTNGSTTMPEDITLSISTPSAGWSVTLDPPQFSFQLAPSASQLITVSVTSPLNAGNTTENTSITVNGGSGATDQAIDRTSTIVPDSGISLVPPARSGQIVPGVMSVYTHTLTNWESSEATIDLAYSQQPPTFTVDVSPANVTLAAGESQEITVQVTAPLGTQVGITHAVNITATSNISAAMATAVDTSLVSFEIALTPGEQVKIKPAGTVITYSHTFTNVNGSNEIFDVSTTNNLGWLDDYNPKTFTLNGGESEEIVVTMTIPIGALPGAEDVTVLIVAWHENSDLSLSATDRARTPQNHSMVLSTAYTQTVSSGSLVTYTHTLLNDGNGQDSFRIDANSSRGWDIPFVTAPIMGLPAGLAAQVIVVLDVPAASNGLIDKLTVTATSIISDVHHSNELVDTTIVSDTAPPPITSTIYLPVILNNYTPPVLPEYELIITPETAAQTVQEGGTAVYTHTVTNNGTGSETVTMTVSGIPATWGVTVTPTNFILVAGASAPITVTVNVPAGSGGQTHVATVTATGSSTETAVATDTTTSSSTPVTPTTTPPPTTPPPTTPPPPTCVFNPPTTGNPPGVDLLVTDITLSPANPVAGDAVTVYVTIKNQGQANMVYNNGFFLDFYVNPSPQPPGFNQIGDRSWGIQSTDFPAGASNTYSANYIFSSTGDMRLWAQVDTDRTVAEADENNNNYGCVGVTVSGTTMINAESTPAPQPDTGVPRLTPTPAFIQTQGTTPEPIWLVTATPFPVLPPQSND